MSAAMSPVNILGLNRQALVDYFAELGEPAFRATQLLQWIHQWGIADFNQMSNLSKKLREKLCQVAQIKPPQLVYQQQASDHTQKWLLQLEDGNCIETVFIPEDDRGTLCISSQVGCVINCSFCSTAQQGFNRNLSVAEIIGQVWLAVRQLSKTNGAHDRQITNIVLMGMGEPLLNFDPVVSALDIMLDDFAYGLSKRRVTLSTSGLVPALQRLKAVSDVSLAVSLHAPTDALRDQLVPINRKYPIAELMAVCKDYFPAFSRRRITFEYVMLAGVNDQAEHAQALVALLQDIPAMVNLIPFNIFPGTQYTCSSAAAIKRFQTILQDAGVTTVTRKTRGDDIDAACGQLVGKVFDKTHRTKQKQALNVILEKAA